MPQARRRVYYLTESINSIDEVGAMGSFHSEIADGQIAAFRQFNRFYSREIGTLREGLLDSEFSLTEARVLYELATRGEATATEIAKELTLDAGYLSRVLRRFEDGGLVKRKVSTGDARQAILIITRHGRDSFADLNERSNRQARRILERVPPSQLPDLLNAMRGIEKTLSPAPKNAPFV